VDTVLSKYKGVEQGMLDAFRKKYEAAEASEPEPEPEPEPEA
jgi:hypothetical protein